MPAALRLSALHTCVSQLSGAKLASDIAKLGAGVKLMQPFCTCYTDTGLFGVYTEMAMAKKEHVDDVIATIQEEVCLF